VVFTKEAMAQEGKMIRQIFMLILAVTLLPVGILMAQDKSEPPARVKTSEKGKDLSWRPRPGYVGIYISTIAMPYGKFLLIKKDEEYLALKFTDSWLGKGGYQLYTSYEYYYQGDGSGAFSKKNVAAGSGEFYDPGGRMSWGIPVVEKGLKDRIKFGKIDCKWVRPTKVLYKYGYFTKVELAPTPWSSISEVNINDPRIRWYQKGGVNKNMEVPIDSLWKDPADGK
jgi:hypothetical protein